MIANLLYIKLKNILNHYLLLENKTFYDGEIDT